MYHHDIITRQQRNIGTEQLQPVFTVVCCQLVCVGSFFVVNLSGKFM